MANTKSKIEIALNIGIVILLGIIITALIRKYLLVPKQSDIAVNSLSTASPSPTLPCLQPEQVESRSSTTQTLILDTRDRTAFGSRRLKGAINIPALELEARALDEVPENKSILLVGNFLPQSQQLLNRLGWKDVLILCGDIQDWEKSDTLVVERINAN